MIKSFRGKLADGESTRIKLSTNQGLVGYVMKKFQILQITPGAALVEGVMKVYTVPQTTVNATIDFTDPTLLAAAFQADYNTTASTINEVIIFDNTVVNQDIYVTFSDASVGETMNYYIELEQVKLDRNEATVATLKDMRGRE
jgi:hypothetical protein